LIGFAVLEAVFKKVRESLADTPTCFVMTSLTRRLLIEQLDRESGRTGPLYPTRLCGIPIEDYPAMLACMDRMMEQKPGERLKLVTAEVITLDCIDHPWMHKQVSEMLSGMDLGL
jgi:hypothetical protein